MLNDRYDLKTFLESDNYLEQVIQSSKQNILLGKIHQALDEFISMQRSHLIYRTIHECFIDIRVFTEIKLLFAKLPLNKGKNNRYINEIIAYINAVTTQFINVFVPENENENLCYKKTIALVDWIKIFIANELDNKPERLESNYERCNFLLGKSVTHTNIFNYEVDVIEYSNNEPTICLCSFHYDEIAENPAVNYKKRYELSFGNNNRCFIHDCDNEATQRLILYEKDIPQEKTNTLHIKEAKSEQITPTIKCIVTTNKEFAIQTDHRANMEYICLQNKECELVETIVFGETKYHLIYKGKNIYGVDKTDFEIIPVSPKPDSRFFQQEYEDIDGVLLPSDSPPPNIIQELKT